MSDNMLDILKNFDAADKGEAPKASSADAGDMKTILESFNAVSEAPMPVPMDQVPQTPAGMPAPQDPGQPVTMNVNVSASGKDHVQDLLDLMKMAGVDAPAGGPKVGDAELDIDLDGDHQPDIALQPKEEDVEEGSIKYMHSLKSKGHSDEEIAKELDMDPEEVRKAMDKTDEDYANEPDEEYGTFDDAIPAGDDLHKKKKAYRATAGGDNPMATETIKQRLLKALAEKKMPMGPGPDGKKGTDDDKPAFLNQKTGAKKSKSDKKDDGMTDKQKKYFGKKK